VFVKTIVLGINGSLYSDPLPIMVNTESFRARLALYAGLELGRRW
jgi:hypothetical protein